ncbi:class I SAM-dependent methyltransferase [Tepidamorphus sp. 3E244]|uniref:class I SAM-dependent methyltransferase n=1 Tax=Tepidamorphus sp. 3E244 TaxID=3385498 RepID=UPI0038FC8664
MTPEPEGKDQTRGRDWRRRFIAENTAINSPPHVPELTLHLASEAFDLWHKTEEELEEIGLPPPFWAFAWAGGQALARYILDNPHIVSGKHVADIGSGSGLVAIASMKAGAAGATAIDVDAFALEAADVNAALNGVSIVVRRGNEGDSFPDLPPETGVLLLGDVFYDRRLAPAMVALARSSLEKGRAVFVGDPGRAYVPDAAMLEELALYEVQVPTALEDQEVRKCRVFRFVG